MLHAGERSRGKAVEKVQLKIDQIVPGMTLAEPITNAGGVTLMPAGIRLTPMFIARIRKWNIGALDVIAEKKPDPARPSDTVVIRRAEAAQAKQREAENPRPADREDFARRTALEISRPFVAVKTNPLMMQLRAAVIKKLVAHGMNGPVNVLRRAAEQAPAEPEQRENADGS